MLLLVHFVLPGYKASHILVAGQRMLHAMHALGQAHVVHAKDMSSRSCVPRLLLVARGTLSVSSIREREREMHAGQGAHHFHHCPLALTASLAMHLSLNRLTIQ